MMKRLSILAAVALIGLLAACSDDTADGPMDGSSGAMATSSSMDGMDGTEETAFGEPGDPGEADRTVEIQLLDELRFDPSEVDVEMGETITFEVTNVGQAVHEFVLGDETLQDEHEMDMGQMGGSLPPDEPNALVVEPGDTESLTWTFTEAGTVLYGCHIPGHYVGGMVGTITVTG